MRNTISLLAVFVLGLLTSLSVGVQTVKAQYTPDGKGFPLASPISIMSPSNSRYSSNLLTLNVTFKLLLDPSCANISYSVDGKNNATLPIEATMVPVMALITYANGTTTTAPAIFSPYTITGYVVLPELPEGPHNITVYAEYQANSVIGLDNNMVYFTIDDGNPPIISNLSLENKTYNTPNIPLNFTVDESTSWIGYSLDEQANVTMMGNTTLAELSYGSHTLTIYANDTVGNMGTSSTIDFNIAEPFPTTLAATASGVALTFVGAGLLVYLKKRDH
jgi:hypothetical protein